MLSTSRTWLMPPAGLPARRPDAAWVVHCLQAVTVCGAILGCDKRCECTECQLGTGIVHDACLPICWAQPDTTLLLCGLCVVAWGGLGSCVPGCG